MTSNAERSEFTPLLHSTETVGFMTSKREGEGSEQRNVKDKEDDSLRSSLPGPSYRRKVIKSIWLSQCCFCQGLVTGLLGPSFLDLQLLTNTNVQQASVFFTAASVGNVAGALLCGLLYDACSKSLLLLVSTVMMAICTALLPFCAVFWLMALVCFVLATICQVVSTLCSADVMRLWGLKGEAVMQAIHFTFSVGGGLAPLITEPFLAPRSLLVGNLSDPSLDPLSLPDSLTPLANDTDSASSYESKPETRIHFAFIISSAVTFLAAAPLVVEYVWERLGKNQYVHIEGRGTTGVEARPSKNNTGEDLSKTKPACSKMDLPRVPYLVVLVWMCVFYALFVSVEMSVANYLTTFAVLTMRWTKSQGALLTTVFWVSFAAGRFACIFLVRVFTSLQLILICFALMVPSFVGLLLSALWQLDWGVWLSSALAGAALSSLFASAFSWMNSELMPVGGRVTSVITLSANVGIMINSQVLGHLIESRGAIWLVYITLGEIVGCDFHFLLLLLFTRCYLRPRYTRPSPSQWTDDVSSRHVGYEALSAAPGKQGNASVVRNLVTTDI